MKKNASLYKKAYIYIFAIIFIFLYMNFLIDFYIIPQDFSIPIVLLIGFGVFIGGIIYFFINLSKFEGNSPILKIKILNENSIKLILLFLMIIAFFIPPISFSETIIDWNNISILNYVRAIIFLIGCSYLPGACIFNIFFDKSEIHKLFKIEPFLFKLNIYPLLSFTFFGTITLILDISGVNVQYFVYILFIAINTIFFLEFIIKKFRKEYYELKISEIKLSKYTIFILFVSGCIVLIAFGFQLYMKYLIPGDAWRGLNYASYVGDDIGISERFYNYSMFWGYIIFSFSKLCGIPYINTNALLFLLLYLFVTSTYLLMKSILDDVREIYAVISTLFVLIFSGLFYIYSENLGWTPTYWVIYDGFFSLRYKSFSYFLLLNSLSIFIITIKKCDNISKIKNTFNGKIYKLIILSAWLLGHSYFIYFLPIIPGITILIIYCFFSNNKQKSFHLFSIFYLFLILFIIIFDIISFFYFSWVSTTYLFYFLLIPSNKIDLLIFNAILFYIVLGGCFLLIKIIELKFNLLFNKNKMREIFKYVIVQKIIFISFFTIFTILLMIEIKNIFINDLNPNLENYPLENLKVENSLFNFYLNILFWNLGIIGILGIYLSHICFKENRRLFYFLITWVLLFLILASIFIFRTGLNNPLIKVGDIDDKEFLYLQYCFWRIWFYSIFPLSIFCSIGLIKLNDYLKNQKYYSRIYKITGEIHNFFIISALIYFSLSTTIIAGIDLCNVTWKIEDDNAQIIGWVSENIPEDSEILTDDWELYYFLKDITFSNAYNILFETVEALDSVDYPKISYKLSNKCYLGYENELDNHRGVLKINDNDEIGGVSFNTPFGAKRQNGTIQYYIRITDSHKNYFSYLIGEGKNGIAFMINNGAFYYNNGTGKIKIMEIKSDKWYFLKFDFECTKGNYHNLNRFSWKVFINDKWYGAYNFYSNISYLESFQFYTDIDQFDYSLFFNDLHFSWYPSLKDNLLYASEIVINHLLSNEINYYIQTNGDSYYKQRAEEECYLINEILTESLYTEKLYKYGKFTIYSSK